MKQIRSNKPLFFSIAALLFLGITVMGFFIGMALLRNTPEWRYLGSPPEKIDELLVANFDTIYVKTVSNSVYSCYWASPYDINCWAKVETIPEVVEDYCAFAQDAPHQLPSGNVIGVLQFHRCGWFAGSDSYSAFNYYLLDDGNVVQWGYDGFHWGWPGGISRAWLRNVIIGSVLGMFCAVGLITIVYFVIFKRESNESSQP